MCFTLQIVGAYSCGGKKRTKRSESQQ